MTIVLAPILGPILGGYICDNYTWNWIFFVNVPVGAVCLVALRIPMAGRETATAKNPIDTVGLILLIIGVATSSSCSTRARTRTGSPPATS